MNEKVKEFIDAKKAEETKKHEEEIKKAQAIRKNTLLQLGIYEKVYSPDGKYSEEYPFYEWDEKEKASKHFKKVLIDVTDEEYEEIKKYTEIKEEEKDKNPIAFIIRIIGIVVYVIGFIASFILGVDEYGDISAMVLVWMIVFFISGTFYLGFAEIIQLLDDIKKK